MSELPLKKEIEMYSFEILKNSKSLDIFPTPVDSIAAYCELIVRNDIDISKIHSTYFSKQLNTLKRALKKVRGALDRKERTIYLDLSQIKERKTFVKLHEIGHAVLPWQKKIYDLIDDDDDSLSEATRNEFEAEANYFASITLFQHDRFLEELNKLGLGIGPAMHLAKHFGASVHATLRRYVEYSNNRCALIILSNIAKKGEIPKCYIRNVFQSAKFSKTFGGINLPEDLGYSWEFVKDYYHGRRFRTDGVIKLPTCGGEVNFHYQFFNNSYYAFVFIFPFGEKKNTRTKFIISSLSND